MSLKSKVIIEIFLVKLCNWYIIIYNIVFIIIWNFNFIDDKFMYINKVY